MEERYTFGVMHLAQLDETRQHLEAFGHTCRVEESEHHTTKLYTLVATPPARANREARGCYMG
jgi:hypothetical protein